MLWQRFTSTLLVLTLSLAGCATSRRNSDADMRVPTDFSIVCGQGGGITGMWEGHTIRPDGTVLSWAGPAADLNPTPAGCITA
jgi:hypothetical protein